MISATLLSILLVLPGTALLLASIIMSLGTNKSLPQLLHRRWYAMSGLMVFFLVGYFSFLVIQITGIRFPLELVTSAVFLGGSIFVFLVMRLTRITIQRITESEQEVSRVNQKLLTQNIELEKEIVARRQAEEQAMNRLRFFSTLHAIDMIITSSLDLRVTLRVFLEQVVPQLRVDAGMILLLDRYTQTLECRACWGFKRPDVMATRERLGEGSAGKAALERLLVRIHSIPDEDDGFFRRKASIAGEDFVGYIGVPLVSKGEVKGVFEIFRRSPIDESEEWYDFLEAVSGQAAIAIDNAALFDELQKSNAELILAYDTTIEGWARALELRDEETEGHTQRVTETTVEVAQNLGVKPEELVHVRRGALLHDIGKMAVPDTILMKDGPLTPEELAVMQEHPAHAFKMLSPIAYLRPALDIPYCHHEKWDGTGYPRKLKGEQIPLPARIFSLADTWDALVNERRYHKAWSFEKAAEHIRGLSGSAFDPQLVEPFLEFVLR